MNVEVKEKLSSEEFKQNYVKTGRPVIIRGVISEWEAARKWRTPYFKMVGGDVKVRTKKGNVSEGKTESIILRDYAKQLEAYEGGATEKPAYLHDVPIFSIMPTLVRDITSFPIHYLPRWYRTQWWSFVQFFMGPRGSVTPLHFDTLYTHNLFFQIDGIKTFTMISADQQRLCYLRNWRWSNVNPIEPDLQKYPLFSKVSVFYAVLQPGDILYIPPGTLHHVTSDTQSISFNIDWHNRTSVLKGMLSSFYGAPWKNFQYNFVAFLGLWLSIPRKFIFSYYKSYLNYIS